jgi:inorganic pyrophosphatase
MSHINHLALPSFSTTGHLQAVIEIPAGTNTKFEYDKTNLVFKPDMRNGKKRVVQFLSYPVNYGFVPSTKMDKARGGDGDPIDVLVLAEHLPTGTIIDVQPIGLLKLEDLGELDHKVLAIPINTDLRILPCTDYQQLCISYPMVKHLLELYFQYYDGIGTMKLMGWGDETEAIAEVKKWVTKSS